MTEAEARVQLERMTAHDTPPALTETEVVDLVEQARVHDPAGLNPDDEGWTPTYNLQRAAKTGWEWKAARASGNFAFAADGERFDRDQVYEHCMAMARHYSRTGTASAVTLASPYGGEPRVELP